MTKKEKTVGMNTKKNSGVLREKYIEPPFTVLDSKNTHWQKRKKAWKELGLMSELGREESLLFNKSLKKYQKNSACTSIFDPCLCEVLYHWFMIPGGSILDPFAGGSVRGIVACSMGYEYTGIEIRREQVESNIQQAKDILPDDKQPEWIVGDSFDVLDTLEGTYDMLFSCPPYGDLEKYSELDGDISNMKYPEFYDRYCEIIGKGVQLLKPGGFAIFVVGEFRDKKGNYVGFVPDTIRAFKQYGLNYYNDGVLLNMLGTAPIRANRNMRNKKLVKVHQNILMFTKDM
jgi:DNA modification methylase